MRINIVQVILNNHKREAQKGFSMWDIYHIKVDTKRIERDAEKEMIEAAYTKQLAMY